MVLPSPQAPASPAAAPGIVPGELVTGAVVPPAVLSPRARLTAAAPAAGMIAGALGAGWGFANPMAVAWGSKLVSDPSPPAATHSSYAFLRDGSRPSRNLTCARSASEPLVIPVLVA